MRSIGKMHKHIMMMKMSVKQVIKEFGKRVN